MYIYNKRYEFRIVMTVMVIVIDMKVGSLRLHCVEALYCTALFFIEEDIIELKQAIKQAIKRVYVSFVS